MSHAIEVGLDTKQRKNVATALQDTLADTFTLYLKTHNYHWNVRGPSFQPLHQVFEEQYNELWAAVDELAERIRALGADTRGTMGDFQSGTIIPADDGVPPAMQMVHNLVDSHEAIARRIRGAIKIAQAADDEVSNDMLIARLTVHEKTAWMLRSFLE